VSFLAELDQLHREALDLARRFAAARPAATGTDPAGAVQVGVTGDGEVDGVTIDPAWRGRFGPDGLGNALAAATGNALRRQVQAWAGHLDEADPVEPPSLPGPVEPPSLLEPVDPAALDDVHYLVVEAIGRLPDLDRPVGPAPARGASPGRRVRVMVVAGQVTAVEFDRAWLACADVTAVAEHARHALRAAFADAAAPGLTGVGPLDEVRALTADPAGLLRRLGLA